MRISIVIPCFNGIADTRLCLAALRRQAGLAMDDLELIVVDNGSEDGTHLLAEEFPQLRVLRQAQNLGFAGGVNAGLRAAHGELLTILNNDTMAAPHLVVRLRDALLADPTIGLTAPVSNHVKGPALIEVGLLGQSESDRQEIEDLLDANPARIQDQETLSGLCLMMRRELFDQVGRFDERFGTGNFEDDDFCLRVRLQGHRLVIVRDAFLYHRGHQTFSSMGLDFQTTLDAKERIFRDKWEQDPAGHAYIARIAQRPDIAAAAATEAAKIYPLWPDVELILGRMRALEGDHEVAIRHLAAFVARCPQHTEARLQLAISRLYADDTEDGMIAFKQTLAECFFTGDELAAALERFASWCLSRERNDLALEHLATAQSIAPERSEVYNLIGVAQLAKNDLDQARAALETSDNLGNSNGTTNLGICHWRAGDRAAAVRYLEKAVRDDPDNQVARNNYAQVTGVQAESEQA